MSKKSDALTEAQKAFIQKHHRKKSLMWMARELRVSPSLIRSYLEGEGKSFRASSGATRRWFPVALILLPILFFLLLEGTLRLVDYGPNLDLFVPLEPFPDYLTVNPDLGLRYFPTSRLKPQVSIDALARKKPTDGIRIFALGGSSAAGYPYLYNGSFSSILKVILNKYYPERPIEVVNLAMPAVNSYTVRDLVQELPAYQPDALLIYAGHNEFYGALGVGSSESLGSFRPLVLAFLKLRHWKIFQLMSDAIYGLRSWLGRIAGEGSARNRTLMERMVGKKNIPYGSDLFQAAHRIFEQNLADIAELARREQIPCFVATVVSNVHDHAPFQDAFSPGTDTAAWWSLYRQAEEHWQAGELDNARALLEQALAVDSLPASAYYLLAHILEKQGAFPQAYRAFYQAKEMDALRFRASEQINQIIVRLAQSEPLWLVPVKEQFEARSPHGLPGKNLLLEHLHPNLQGYILMARAFAQKLVESGVLGKPTVAEVPDSLWLPEIGVTDVDLQVARLRIQVLMNSWPFTSQPPPAKEEIPLPPAEDVIGRLAVRYWREEITWEKMHVLAADFYTRTGQLEKAEREYRALILATPMNPSPYQLLARLLLYQKKFGQAEPVLHQILQLTPDPFAYKMLGSIYVNRGDLEAGLPLLQRAVQLNPNDAQAWYNFAGALALAHRHEEAMAALERLRRLQPDFPGAAQLRARLRAHMAQIQQSGEPH